MKTLFNFLCAAYLFSLGITRPATLANILHISQYQILDWAMSPLFHAAIYMFGHRAPIKMRGLEKHRKKRREFRTNVRNYHVNRMNRLKSEMLRQYGAMTNDLRRAESEWTKLFSEVNDD